MICVRAEQIMLYYCQNSTKPPGVETKIAIGTFSSSLSLVLFLLLTGAEERVSALAVAAGGLCSGGLRYYGSGGHVLSCLISLRTGAGDERRDASELRGGRPSRPWWEMSRASSSGQIGLGKAMSRCW